MNRTIQNPNKNAAKEAVIRAVEQAAQEQFYGEIVVKFRRGAPTLLTRTQTTILDRADNATYDGR